MKERIDPTKELRFSARLLGNIVKNTYVRTKPQSRTLMQEMIEPYLKLLYGKK